MGATWALFHRSGKVLVSSAQFIMLCSGIAMSSKASFETQVGKPSIDVDLVVSSSFMSDFTSPRLMCCRAVVLSLFVVAFEVSCIPRR